VDVTTYEWLLFGHLLFVAIWVGGDAMIQVFFLRSRVAGPAQVVQFAKDVEWIGMRVLTPAALIVVAFGFGLVAERDWDLGDFWLSFGLAVFLASFLTGAGFLGPESGRIGKLAEERDPSDPEVQRRIARIALISRLELLFLVLVVFDMVAKPWL
jgi:uncharacterized membrane protein